MVSPAALAGQYRLFPGKTPSIEGRRPVLAAGRLRRLLAGQTPDQAVRTLGSLFTLCAHAHQRTARMALTAAHASYTSVSQAHQAEQAIILILETARDHLRSIALDWPQRLGVALAPAQQLAWLKACPLPLVSHTPIADEMLAWRLLAQLNDWLGAQVLQQPTRDWLAQHRGTETLAAWCTSNAERLLPARWLAASLPHTTSLTFNTRALKLLDPDPALQRCQWLELVAQMQHDPDFCQYPSWRGQCAENGPWTRLRHASASGELTLTSRVASRWIELLELAQATPETLAHAGTPLASGVHITGAGQALAWCEMARGLLLHWAHCDTQGRVLDYKVVAPTEWNFHPQGALARVLTALSPADGATAQHLAAAFDPCVACTV